MTVSAPSPAPRPKPKRRRFSKRRFAVLLVVVLGVALVWSLFPRIQAQFFAQDRAIGQNVSVPRGAQEDLKADAADFPPLPVEADTSWLDQLVSGIDLQPHGPLAKPVTFTVKLPRALTEREVLLVRVNHSDPYDVSKWEPVPAQLSKDRKRASFTLSRLSGLEVDAVDPYTLKDFWHDLLEEAFPGAQEAEEPKCNGKSEAEAKGYRFDPDPQKKGDPKKADPAKKDKPFLMCYGMDGSDYPDPEFELTNTRRYPMEVTEAKGLPVSDEGDIPFSMVQARRLNHTIVMPRESMTFHVNPLDPGTSTTLKAEASNWGTALAVIDAFAQALLLLFAASKGIQASTKAASTAFKAGKATKLDTFGLAGITVEKFMSMFLDNAECSDAMKGDNRAKWITSCFKKGTLIAAFAFGLGRLTFAFAAVLLFVTAVIAITSVVFALLDLPRLLLNFFGDKMNERGKYELKVERKAEPLVGTWSHMTGGDDSTVVLDTTQGTGTITEHGECGFATGVQIYDCKTVVKLKNLRLSGDKLNATVASVLYGWPNDELRSTPSPDASLKIFNDDPVTLMHDKKDDRISVQYGGKTGEALAKTFGPGYKSTYCSQKAPAPSC